MINFYLAGFMVNIFGLFTNLYVTRACEEMGMPSPAIENAALRYLNPEIPEYPSNFGFCARAACFGIKYVRGMVDR